MKPARASEGETHLRLEIAHAVHRGHRPGWPPPLAEGEPVPGCGCPTCTGVPADHPARHSGKTSRRREVSEPLPVEQARRVPILEAAERLGVNLKRVGKSYRGPCPIHGGEGPNLSVLPERGRFRCFVCGEAGDVIELVQRLRGCTFVEAVKVLAA